MSELIKIMETSQITGISSKLKQQNQIKKGKIEYGNKKIGYNDCPIYCPSDCPTNDCSNECTDCTFCN